MSERETVKARTTDNELKVFWERDLTSPSHQLEKGVDIEVGAASLEDGREWMQVTVPNRMSGFSLGPFVRSHTDLPSNAPVPEKVDQDKDSDLPYEQRSSGSIWSPLMGWALIVIAILGGGRKLANGDKSTLETVFLMFSIAVALIARFRVKGWVMTVGGVLLLTMIFGIAFGHRSSTERSELSAIGSLRKIHTAQTLYHEQYGRYAKSLAELGPPPGADLIHQDIANGSREGYNYVLSATPTGYTIILTPLSGRTRSFYSDQTMMVTQSTGPELPGPTSPPIGSLP